MNTIAKKPTVKEPTQADVDYIHGLLVAANDESNVVRQRAACMALAGNEFTPTQCLDELLTVAFMDGDKPLVEALLRNPNLPAFNTADRVLVSA